MTKFTSSGMPKIDTNLKPFTSNTSQNVQNNEANTN